MGYWGIRLTGYEKTGVCWWCGGPLAGRRTTFCSTGCRGTYFRLFAWGQRPSAVQWALERCHGKCQGCGVTGKLAMRGYGRDRLLARNLSVHHIVPLNGEPRAYTIKNLPYNLRVYCPECHAQHRDDGNSILGLQIAEYLSLDAEIAQEVELEEDKAAAAKRV